MAPRLMRPDAILAREWPAAEARQPKFRRWYGQFSGWPVVPAHLWATLLLTVVAGLNLRWQAEIWPHTPRAATIWAWLLVGSGLLLVPQFLLLGWRWVQDYRGPAVLRVVMQLFYLCGSVVGLVVWLLGCIIGLFYCLDSLR